MRDSSSNTFAIHLIDVWCFTLFLPVWPGSFFSVFFPLIFVVVVFFCPRHSGCCAIGLRRTNPCGYMQRPIAYWIIWKMFTREFSSLWAYATRITLFICSCRHRHRRQRLYIMYTFCSISPYTEHNYSDAILMIHNPKQQWDEFFFLLIFSVSFRWQLR